MSPFDSDSKVLRIILIVWLSFGTLYFVNSEYSRFKNFIAKNAYAKGTTETVAKLFTEAKKCQPIPITVGEAKVALVSVDCLNGGAQPPAPAAPAETN